MNESLQIILTIFALFMATILVAYILWNKKNTIAKADNNIFQRQLLNAIEKKGDHLTRQYFDLAVSMLPYSHMTGYKYCRSLAIGFLDELAKRFTGVVEITHIGLANERELEYGGSATWLIKVSNILPDKREMTAYIIASIEGKDLEDIKSSKLDLANAKYLIEDRFAVLTRIQYVLPEVTLDMGLKETHIIEATEASEIIFKEIEPYTDQRGRLYELKYNKHVGWVRDWSTLPEKYQERNLTDENVQLLWDPIAIQMPQGKKLVTPHKLLNAMLNGMLLGISFELEGDIGSGKTTFAMEIIRRASLNNQVQITRLSQSTLTQLEKSDFDWDVFDSDHVLGTDGEYHPIQHILIMDQAELAMLDPTTASFLLQLTDGTYSDQFNIAVLLIRNHLDVVGAEGRAIRKDLTRSGRLKNVEIFNIKNVDGPLQYLKEQYGDDEDYIIDEELLLELFEKKTDQSEKNSISLAEVFNDVLRPRSMERDLNVLFDELLEEEEKTKEEAKAKEQPKTASTTSSRVRPRRRNT